MGLGAVMKQRTHLTKMTKKKDIPPGPVSGSTDTSIVRRSSGGGVVAVVADGDDVAVVVVVSRGVGMAAAVWWRWCGGCDGGRGGVVTCGGWPEFGRRWTEAASDI
ncbi:hypothetical protein Tco_0988045 [Tanacetum coccineum]|uniref:Uncharacterized protein n=1 Tax=Tanacetum coccineum TaxID=301880 RepID=A0ABQ5EPY1_9ASTR